jgi:hypothetical protein
MANDMAGVNDWRSFEAYAARYLSTLWATDLTERSVLVDGLVRGNSIS